MSTQTSHICEGLECCFTSNRTAAHLLYHIQQNIPTRLQRGDIGLLPRRSDFAGGDKQALAAAMDKQIRDSQKIMFLPNAISEPMPWTVGIDRYVIYMYGILPCGNRVCIILEGAPVTFEVAPPADMPIDAFKRLLSDALHRRKVYFERYEVVELYPLHGFVKAPRPHLRYTFKTLKDREGFARVIDEMNCERASRQQPRLVTSADDGCKGGRGYFNKAARELHFSTADWNIIHRYVVVSAEEGHTANCKYTLRVAAGDLKRLSTANRKILTERSPVIGRALTKDMTMIGMWDIETHRTIQNGMVPTPADTDFKIFMICSSYHWHWSATPLFTVCMVETACASHPGINVVVECGSERGVLEAHAIALGRMSPDLLGAFNGGNFDWPLYREKLRREGLLMLLYDSVSCMRTDETEETILKYRFRPLGIKIDPETTHEIQCSAMLPGIIDTDVMAVFLGIYPKAEIRKGRSLNYFLGLNGLPSKEDMPYKRMFRIYERAQRLASAPTECHCEGYDHMSAPCAVCRETISELDCQPAPPITDGETRAGELSVTYTSELHADIAGRCCACGKRPRNVRDMADVAYYCVVDCLRPQQLYVKQSVVMDKREVSTLSFVGLIASFNQANGMKVCNLTGAYCHKYGVAFSNRRVDKGEHERDHYPGGWVFPLHGGLYSDGWSVIDGVRRRHRPIGGFDFTSLYPSIMMALNISTDMIVDNPAEATRLMEEGYELHHIGPFAYEQGKDKGAAANQHLTAEAWVVLHKGCLPRPIPRGPAVRPPANVSGDTTVSVGECPQVIITGYKKMETLTYVDSEGNKQVISGPAPLARLEDKLISRKVSYDPIRGRKQLPNERMGILSLIVKKIIVDKRLPIKAEYLILCDLVKKLKASGATHGTVGGVEMSLEDILFHKSRVEAKQKALKLLGNTVYGKSGDCRTGFYRLEVAGGITTAGQAIIKLAAEFVKSRGFTIHYGDTDSLYLSCSAELFAECDAAYEAALAEIQRAEDSHVNQYQSAIDADEAAAAFKARRIAARVAWWTEEVKITMRAFDGLREEMSDYLLQQNGTTFLNMAYDEIVHPMALLGKKKYFGIGHMNTINYYPDEFMIKGVDIIKQGHAPITRRLGMEFIAESLSPANDANLIELVRAKIISYYAMVKAGLNPADFVLTARLRIGKKNVPVLTFAQRCTDRVNRMRDDPDAVALHSPPDPGDKFEYFIVRVEQSYDDDGHIIPIKKGDQMEHLRVYYALQDSLTPMKIDIDYYMKNMIVGILARFIAHQPEFQPSGEYDISDKDQYKKFDKECVKAAVKYLTDFCDEITGFDKTVAARVGRAYQKQSRLAKKYITADITERYGRGMSLLSLDSRPPKPARGESAISIETHLMNELIARARDCAPEMKSLDPYGDMIVRRWEAAGLTVYRQSELYSNGTSSRRAQVCPVVSTDRQRCIFLDDVEKRITRDMRALVEDLPDILRRYGHSLVDVIESVRRAGDNWAEVLSGIDFDQLNDLPVTTVELLCRLDALVIELAGVYITRMQTQAITAAILRRKKAVAGVRAAPPASLREKYEKMTAESTAKEYADTSTVWI
jgi:DNA polymerase elongation subunit (family B)